MALTTARLAPVLGAEISGIDLAEELDNGAVVAIKAALAEHGVLVFPGQCLDDAAHVRFARHFGKLGKFRNSNNRDGLLPEIFRLSNTDSDGSLLPAGSERLELLRLNMSWHIDSSYRAIPTRGAILHGIEVCVDGGDTVFANMVAAYEGMPAAMKLRIDNLASIHDFGFQVRNRGLPPMSEEELGRLPPVVHPLVREHADGRRSLYLSPPYIETIVGWSRESSQALVQELTNWAAQDRFIYRHRWRPNDLIMWDNGWTMHKVSPFNLAQHKRLLHGVLILGDEAVLPAFAGHDGQS
jgi:alpha-ketoglutarate-dependent taurine dioxygenase